MDTAPDIRAEARRLVEQLPEGASWDDLMYAIYVRQAVAAGEADVATGRVVPQADVRARLGLPPRRGQSG